jgi:hypothetical protein
LRKCPLSDLDPDDDVSANNESEANIATKKVKKKRTRKRTRQIDPAGELPCVHPNFN